MLIKSRAVAAVTTWALVVLSSPVTSHATDTADADAGDFDGRGGIPEILVSARRRAENAQDVPIPITALTGGSLEEAGQFRLEDLNERLPSLNVLWDNRATQHRAIADFGLQRRTLRRATITGDVPVAVDGRTSRAIKPEPQERQHAVAA